MTGSEYENIRSAHAGGILAGDGHFTHSCHRALEKYTNSHKVLLTHSCTAALEIAALTLKISPGDEIIMPSYTFPSTANAFVLRGAVPVFVDIRADTLNLDERLIEDAITDKTRAIVPVHYAGVACEMDALIAIARKHSLYIIEDAAQGTLSRYKGAHLGSIGDIGALSFHETKNISSGQGGAILLNNKSLVSRSEILRDKGTNRSAFNRGEVDRYSWQEVGSSFLPGELVAAFLWAQLQQAESITARRISSWNYYHSALATLEESGLIRRPIVPDSCEHNGHMYYVLLSPDFDRKAVLDQLAAMGINAVFHYSPLHSSVAGQRYCRTNGAMTTTSRQSERIVRLPLWTGMAQSDQERVANCLESSLNRQTKQTKKMSCRNESADTP